MLNLGDDKLCCTRCVVHRKPLYLMAGDPSRLHRDKGKILAKEYVEEDKRYWNSSITAMLFFFFSTAPWRSISYFFLFLCILLIILSFYFCRNPLPPPPFFSVFCFVLLLPVQYAVLYVRKITRELQESVR